jgi:hypothetical protein
VVPIVAGRGERSAYAQGVPAAIYEILSSFIEIAADAVFGMERFHDARAV